MVHQLLQVLVGAAHVAAARAALGSTVELMQKEAPWERAHGAGANASLRERLLARRLQTTSTVTLPELTMLMSVYRCVMCLSNGQDYCPVTGSCANVGECSSGCSTCNNPGGGFCDYVTPGGDAEMLCINYVVNDLLPVVLCTPSQNNCECYASGTGSVATTTTTTTTPLFHCDVDVASWLISWSDAKMAYCCAHVGFGCTSSTTTLSSTTTTPTTVIASTTPTTDAPTTVTSTVTTVATTTTAMTTSTATSSTTTTATATTTITNTATTATTTSTTAAAATITDTTTATATTTATTTFTVAV